MDNSNSDCRKAEFWGPSGFERFRIEVLFKVELGQLVEGAFREVYERVGFEAVLLEPQPQPTQPYPPNPPIVVVVGAIFHAKKVESFELGPSAVVRLNNGPKCRRELILAKELVAQRLEGEGNRFGSSRKGHCKHAVGGKVDAAIDSSRE